LRASELFPEFPSHEAFACRSITAAELNHHL